jgi:molybdopterin-containing oxidoreductase family iron-sulfur binding subunit
MRQFPGAMWVAWEPVSNENMYSGSELASGTRYQPLPDYTNAEVILSLDADFLLTESESVAAAAGFASGRNVSAESDSMNRLYIIESLFSLTGASADHRLAVAPDQIAGIVRAIAVELRNLGVAVSPDITGEITEVSPEIQDWVRPLAADLVRAGRNALICVGRRQPAAIHALAMHLNQALGNTGTTISYTLPADSVHSSLSDLITLTRRMNSGEISELVILGGNPVYNAPDDLEFVSALSRVATSIHLASHVDETSSETTWHIPRAHFLESWGDARTVDGSVGIIQPLIEPLFGGISDIEMLAAIAGMSDNSSYDILRQTWRHEWGARFDTHWPQALHDGIIEGSAAMTVVPEVNSDRIASELKALPPAGSSVQLQFLFHADNCLGDGTDANNGWLQELPDPITKLAWDNAATVSPATAEQLGATNEDMVWLDFGHCELKLPIWIVPGQADGVIGLGLGYGRTRAGHVGNNRGFNTYALRTSSTMHIARGVTATLADQTYALANTQDHGSMEGRPIVREASLEDYRAHPDFATEAAPHPPLVSLWEERSYDQGYQWGMAIDLTKCIGCGVCTLACQSENNIPIVGKTETRKGREMHWIRIDRYFVGDVDTPQIVHQPVACQHCENAPCEQVCPVAATVHDEEGLNAMVYNRCIGTRYCANNCPYKVRRFNFFNFTGDTPEVTKMAQNPDVTVRSRGVMEKCSYCLQRITAGKRRAKLEGREVNDGEIKVACQQSCPTDAFVFGNIRDPESRVAQVKKQNRSYDLLAELNVKPRTSYLAKLRNPNPEMPS